MLANVKRDTEVLSSNTCTQELELLLCLDLDLGLVLILLYLSAAMLPSIMSLRLIAHAADFLWMLLCCCLLLVRDRRAAADTVRHVAYMNGTAQC